MSIFLPQKGLEIPGAGSVLIGLKCEEVLRRKFTKCKTEKNLYDLILVDFVRSNRCTYAGVVLSSGCYDLKQVQ